MEIDRDLKEALGLPQVSQVCIAVRSLDKAVAYYEHVLGLGPFVRPEIHYDEKLYLGQPTGAEWEMAFCSLGPVELELAHSLSSPNLYDDFVKQHGEGLHHLKFLCPPSSTNLG